MAVPVIVTTHAAGVQLHQATRSPPDSRGLTRTGPPRPAPRPLQGPGRQQHLRAPGPQATTLALKASVSTPGRVCVLGPAGGSAHRPRDRQRQVLSACGCLPGAPPGWHRFLRPSAGPRRRGWWVPDAEKPSHPSNATPVSEKGPFANGEGPAGLLNTETLLG